jgi:hypothetical protein
VKYELDGIEFVDARLYALFRDGRQEVSLNRQQYRAYQLVLWLSFEPPIYPWQWDWDNYSGDNKDMIGFYYPEDLPVIMQLKIWAHEKEMDDIARRNAGKERQQK